MKTASMCKTSAHWLRRVNIEATACSVQGCQVRPTIAVASDQAETTFMCVHHALAWSESTLFRDYAQHNSGVSAAALSAWLHTSRAGA